MKKFDLKDTADLIRGFNASFFRITSIENVQDKQEQLNKLGKHLVDVGEKLKKVKLV